MLLSATIILLVIATTVISRSAVADTVTDGACMTSASCVNPSLTYMALTARAANFAVEALKKGEL